MQQDKDFKLNITSNTIADVYLSCSWRPDAGQDAAWHIVKELDSKKIKVVGECVIGIEKMKKSKEVKSWQDLKIILSFLFAFFLCSALCCFW